MALCVAANVASLCSALHAAAAFSSFFVCARAHAETHLPYEVRAVALLPYSVVNGCAPICARRARHVRDGFARLCCSACDDALAFAETQLPNAFLPFLPAP